MPITSSLDLSHLNDAQRRAAAHYEGPLLVVAGAGSGKTRTLTYRIASLVLNHRVNPEHILAVTFTNKAAREMKQRIEQLFADRRAEEQFGKAFQDLAPLEQTRLRSQVYKNLIKPMWIGTFHSLCSRILRFDIEKFKDERGRQWQRNFSIFDDSDSNDAVKKIVVRDLELDDRKFNPRSVRYAISNAKNQGLTPSQFEQQEPNFRGRNIAEVYRRYQDVLAQNNALDFDDLIWVPMLLFKQNEAVLDYWHRQFRHILVDEYQDTNHTQYELVRLLTTNDRLRTDWDWRDRSVFAVGDGDQSIYAFRGADYRILMGFQDNFGDGQPDDRTQTLVKLEENYRSSANILQVANALIQRNTERIDKVLRPTRPEGDAIRYYRAEHEQDEANFAIGQIRALMQQDEISRSYGDFAILYRTNAQSRPFEDQLLRWGLPYTVVGGLRFYDRKEIKDILAYLKVIHNSADTLSITRIINTPRRGIGSSTVAKLQDAAQQLGMPLWEILSDETSVKSLVGRSSSKVIQFAQMVDNWRSQAETLTVLRLLEIVADESGYVRELKLQNNDESESRLENIQELFNAVQQFQEESDDPTLSAYLSQASLSSNLEDLQKEEKSISLMTLHSAKGLEFPVVFLVGLEQGLFPHFRSQDDAEAMEEERRLCYVGITRAEEQLYITHAEARRLYGRRELALPSPFLTELPQAALLPLSDSALPTQKKEPALMRKSIRDAEQQKPTPRVKTQTVANWKVGDRLEHSQFGQGQITHVFGVGNKVSIAVKFIGLGQQKILDPRLAPIEKL
ncbi:DNA helicase PcrA [Synechococcus sp. PCC 7336]|uniref:DNA helicase PcrA n=1 Tax=Synechococcus sp. PCC 7336 TaxID=195250 RepID=UPI000376DE9C|nr:DNA helicase PcrA [Synechococcus sp. PCC 7336]